MRLGFTHRKSQGWVQSMRRLALQAGPQETARLPSYHAARTQTDTYLTQRLKTDNPIPRREHLDKLIGRLERKDPRTAAFVNAAERPRRFEPERAQVRSRIAFATASLAADRAEEALEALRQAEDCTTLAKEGAFVSETRADLPRLVQCVSQLVQTDVPAAVCSSAELLLSVARRGHNNPSEVKKSLLRDLTADLVRRLHRCDRLLEHRHTDRVMPSVIKLLKTPQVFNFEQHIEPSRLVEALDASEDSLESYADLHGLAADLSASATALRDALPLVKLCAERRLKAVYWQTHDDDFDGVVPACLTYDAPKQWAFNKQCELLLQSFFAQQTAQFRADFSENPMAGKVDFNTLFFNAEQCLRALWAGGTLDGASDVQIMAMLHYFLEDLYMFPEAP